MKAISFVLFGDKPIYLTGAIRNAEQYPKFFPGWTCVFYIEDSVPDEIYQGLLDRGAQTRPYSEKDCPNGMFKRFEIADDPSVERFLVRDVDSRPSQRERNAVQAWEDSGKDCHVIRDHPFHAVWMLGGLWGAKGGVLKNVEQSIKRFSRAKFVYNRETQYGADQEWLWANVWPHVQRSGLIHDSCTRHKFGGVPFPDGLSEGDFVGSIYDDKDQPNTEHLKVRNEYVRLRNQ